MPVVLQLGLVLFMVYVWIQMKSQHPHLTFPSFFLFLDEHILHCTHCLCTIHGIHNHFIKKKILKMGLTALFIYLKIILL